MNQHPPDGDQLAPAGSPGTTVAWIRLPLGAHALHRVLRALTREYPDGLHTRSAGDWFEVRVPEAPDWLADETMTDDETLARFDALNPEPTRANSPVRVSGHSRQTRTTDGEAQ